MKHITKNIWVCPFFNGKSTTKAFEEKIIWHRIQVWKKSSSQILIKAITTGNRVFAVCQNVCRGRTIGHMAKTPFAVCLKTRHTTKSWHTARVPDDLTHGKKNAHGKLDTFAVCLTYDTRQRRRPVTPFAPLSPLPCAWIKHTAKILVAVCFILCTRQRCSKTIEFWLRKCSGIRIHFNLLHAKRW